MKTLAGIAYLLLVVFVFVPTTVGQVNKPAEPRALPSPFRESDELRFPEIRTANPEGYPVRREPRTVKEGLLAPSAQDRFEHEGFLKQSNTGLIRLLPREIYDSQTYIPAKRVEMRGGGAYFSFVHRSHQYGYGSDLELSRSQLSVGFAGADYGMLIRLGDVPLDAIPQDDPRLTYMATYKPPYNVQEARSEFRDFAKGREVDGFLYQRIVPARANSTYLLRSINYRVGDVFVAFRVTRFDSDRSAIIAWKLLKSYSTPELR